MPTLREEMDQWLPNARHRVARFSPEPRLDQVGRVEHVGDGVAFVSGLPDTRLDEMLVFSDQTLGMAVSLEHGRIGCVLIGSEESIGAGSKVHGTGEVARVPVGEELLGRVVDAVGAPLDGGKQVVAERYDPLERPAPAIVERDLVRQPLQSGVTVIDAMIPLGRGQRELVIGDRKTGKTALAVDTIINQRDSDVICVYASVGQKTATLNQVIEAIQRYGQADRCVFVAATAGSSLGAIWLAPYAACTIAEFFRDRGQDALLVIDDLTKHAAVYRQLSLLLRNPPGREAYPGDIFYIHSRLLERAAKLSNELGGGSLTTLPIAETQAGNISAYIPTNLISMTDGQIYLDPKLFYEGQKPAVDVGKSVSRVGGSTQTAVVKDLANHLRLEYAQFLELEVFTRFGTVVDERTKRRIEHGRRIRAVLSQPQFRPLPLSHQAALLVALQEHVLDDVPLELVDAFKEESHNLLQQTCPQILRRVDESGSLDPGDRQKLTEVLQQLADKPSAEPAKDDQPKIVD